MKVLVKEDGSITPLCDFITLSAKDIGEIERALGIVEGVAWTAENNTVADALFSALETIDTVLNKKENGNDKD